MTKSMGFSFAQSLFRTTSFSFFVIEPAEQRTFKAQLGKQRLKESVMLLCEKLGGRHERRLIPVIDRDIRGGGGDGGLAASHVAAEDSLHRNGFPHICGDLRNAPLLRSGKLIGKKTAHTGRVRIGHR